MKRNSIIAYDCNHSDMSGETIMSDRQNSNMGKEDRRRVVLQFLSEHGLALPQGAIYRNLRLHHNITFSYSSVDNYLDSFVDEGLCRRVDPKPLEDRELVDMDRGKENKAYYIITEKGREYIND